MQILNILKQLGLSEKKARIYLALLELGGGSVIDIAKKTKIKRTTVYNILPELMDEGLIIKTKRHSQTFYLAEDPENLKDSLQSKLELVDQAIPQLTNIYNVFPFLILTIRFL